MKFLHIMIKVENLEKSLDFWLEQMGFIEFERNELDEFRKTTLLLSKEGSNLNIELDYNWDTNEEYSNNQSFGHIAFEVDDLYKTCSSMIDSGVSITFPPKDGKLAYVISPDNIEIELFQKGDALPPSEPWLSMKETKQW